mmetsp:Transcript_1313/g.5621  ORF Transcript_1313/g.5621 Transcript_1313/m.5621 type:complete len:219 (-) Transcript_1313:490-1146(-)
MLVQAHDNFPHPASLQMIDFNWQVMQPLNQGGADRLVRQLPLGAVKGLDPLRHLAEQIVVQQQIVKILLLKSIYNLWEHLELVESWPLDGRIAANGFVFRMRFAHLAQEVLDQLLLLLARHFLLPGLLREHLLDRTIFQLLVRRFGDARRRAAAIRTPLGPRYAELAIVPALSIPCVLAHDVRMIVIVSNESVVFGCGLDVFFRRVRLFVLQIAFLRF